MFWASHVLLLSLIVPFAFSQTAQPPSKSVGSVEGVVAAVSTRDPLKKAWVTLHKADGQGMTSGALTDATGHFTLKDIEPGRYRLVAERSGYVRQEYGQPGPDSSGTILSISPGQSIRDIQLAMTPSGVLSGRVYDDDAESVVDAHVTAMKFIYHEGKRE